MTYEITPTGLVRVSMTGLVEPAAVVAYLDALAADPRLRPRMPQLVDMRGVTQPAPAADLERLATTFERMRAYFHGARCAVLVASPAMFGSVRQFGSLAEGSGLDVTPFADERETYEWLGIAWPPSVGES